MAKKKDKETKEKSEFDKTISQIEKEFGKGIVVNLNSKTLDVKAISTGSLSLDFALGVGGFPKGRIIEVYGGESSAKTTLCLTHAKQVQDAGGRVVYIDMENAINFEFAQLIGLDFNKKFTIIQPEYGEQALEIVGNLLESKEVDLIVIDSVASLVPKAELEGTMEDVQMGLMARMMGKALRKFTAMINQTNTCVIFINQTREKIGVVFGSRVATPGGNALKFYASVRVALARITTIKKGEESIGIRVKATIKKNKVAPPFKTAEFELYFYSGICPVADIIGLALKYKVIEKSGAWFFKDEDQIAQGLEKTRKYFKENKGEFIQLKKEVIEKMEEKG